MPNFLILLAFVLAMLVAGATDNHRAVIVSYPNDTPESVLDQAKQTIQNDGGSITHEYSM